MTLNQERVAAGLCGRCGKRPHRADGTWCEPCVVKRKRDRDRRRDEGQCQHCSKPAEIGKTQCAQCSDKRAIKRHPNTCIAKWCRTPAEIGKAYCTKHLARSLTNVGWAVKERAAAKRKATISPIYRAQRGRCAGCRLPLPIRLLAIDHIIPKSMGGGNEPRNLQLLCSYCNSAKHAGAHADLLAALRARGIIDAAGNNIEGRRFGIICTTLAERVLASIRPYK